MESWMVQNPYKQGMFTPQEVQATTTTTTSIG
jgi:hypothetical protein